MVSGLEISCRQLGDFLQEVDDGRHIILRGKYRGCFLDKTPRGYIRKYILVKWVDDMTSEERELFETFGRKDTEAAAITEWTEDEEAAVGAKKEVDASTLPA